MEIQQTNLQFIVEPLLAWYERNKRDLPWRHNATPYRVWVSEIMLQQTRVDPVIPYYQRFMQVLPDVESLASVPEDQLMKLWEGLGYYSRARNLQKAACAIVAAGAFPTDYEGWLALPGIGAYTAGAICSIALGLPTPAVDGNVLRVLSRILGSRADIALPQTKNIFTQALRAVYPEGRTSGFTQSLMELGAIICLPNGEPKCAACPLEAFCKAKKQNLIDVIPVKTGKKPRKTEEKTVLILRCKNKIALHRRDSKGLLANLWEFPNLCGKLSEKEVLDLLSLLEPAGIKALDPAVHIFTHIEWHMYGFEVLVKHPGTEYQWFSIEDVLQEKAVPSAFRSYTNYLREQRYEEI